VSDNVGYKDSQGNMSRAKFKSNPLTREIGQKVRVVRTALALSQSRLAERLRVSRSQIAEWENGKEECPSAEKLLAIAKIAPTSELRTWFLTAAGVDLERIKADLHAQLQFAPISGPAKPVKLPVWRVATEDPNGRIIRDSDQTLPFPLELTPHPLMTVWLRTGERLPWFESGDDLFVVDRSTNDPRNLLGKLCAIYFTAFPPGDGRMESEDYKVLLDAATSWHSHPAKDGVLTVLERAQRGVAYALRPGYLVGWLEIQSSIEIINLHDVEEDLLHEPTPWRVVLRTGGLTSKFKQIVPISTWQAEGLPLEDKSILLAPIVRDGIEIFGQILGWVSPRATSYWQRTTEASEPNSPND
jgi:transcriptional regulator with XRE-family HTH domain